MKASDFRIGNLAVEWITGEFFRISIRDLITLSKFEAEEEHPFRPIPLTEEKLLKCGAKKDKHITLDINYNNRLLFTKMHTDYFQIFAWDDDDNLVLLIDRQIFLHELQNLFFALTNKELEIEL